MHNIQQYAASFGEKGGPAQQGADRSIYLPHPTQPLFLAVVCDGVSSSAHNKEAADSVTQHMAKVFRDVPETTAHEQLEIWLVSELERVQRHIVQQYGADNALCTVVSSVIDTSQCTIVYATAGDSFLGLFSPDTAELQRLTDPDTRSQPVKQNGNILYQHGVPIMAQGLTKCVGQTGPLSPHFGHIGYTEGDWLLLFSDGVETRDAQQWLLRQPFPNQRSLDTFVEKQSHQQRDDATLIALRLGFPEGLNTALASLANWSAISPEEKRRTIHESQRAQWCEPQQIKELLRQETSETLRLLLVDWWFQHSLPHRTELVSLLDEAVQNKHEQLADLILKALRSSM